MPSLKLLLFTEDESVLNVAAPHSLLAFVGANIDVMLKEACYILAKG